MNDHTFTIWSNGGRHEWILRRGDDIVKRSGLVFSSRAKAKRDFLKNVNVEAL